MLSSGNITNWVLTLTAPNFAGGSPDMIDFATQTQTLLSGLGTTATATQLTFDFSASPSFFLLQGIRPDYFWCLEAAASSCTGAGLGEHMGRGTSSVVAQTTIHSGRVVFANVRVPEPGTLALFGLGLAGLDLARRKRKAA